MKIFKISFLACFFALALNAADNANDETYVFEAKGEFAKELKSLIEKHSKDENVTVNIYKSTPAAGGKAHGGKVNRNVNSLKEKGKAGYFRRKMRFMSRRKWTEASLRRVSQDQRSKR